MYFLAGVANVEMFKDEELLIEGKTLIDSSITIGVSAEDIRAGKGAKLYGKYFHDTTFDLKISDVMFRMEYLIENFGTDIKLGGDTIVEENFIAKDEIGTCALKHTPIPFNDESNIIVYWKHISDNFYKTKKIELLSSDDVLVYRKDNDNDFNILIDDNTHVIVDDIDSLIYYSNNDSNNDNVITLGETKIGEMYCVKYLYTDDSVRKIAIGSEIIPNILSVYLTASLYKGDKENLKTASKVGTITIKIPKFLLFGNQEISLNMTGFAINTIEGTALSCKRGFCDQKLYYAEIIEVIEDRTLDNLKSIKIYADEEGLFIHSDSIDTKLKVYANFDDCGLAIINNNNKIDFFVEDEDILKVDHNGVIHPIGNGVTKITASIYGLSDTIYVKVVLYNNEEDNDYDNGILISNDVFVYVDDIDILLYKSI